ncbi:MAG: hypothetical protein V7750_14235, partial [Sneathiella sp.]
MSLWRPSLSNQKTKVASADKVAAESPHSNLIGSIADLAREKLIDTFSKDATASDVTQAIKSFTRENLEKQRLKLNVLEQRDLVSELSKILWLEIEESRKVKEPIQSATERLVPEENSDPFAETIPSVTQIPEEGITVFGADLSAPVEVTAKFEQPDAWEPHSPSSESDEFEQE